MKDRTQLPFLVRLLEDDSPDVRDSVLNELASYGTELDEALASMGLQLTPERARLVKAHIVGKSRYVLRERWPEWTAVQGEKERLEAALIMLAEYMDNNARPGLTTQLLDQLAGEYSESAKTRTVRTLARYLFAVKKFSGAKDDYYEPQNSSLLYVLEERRGIPITLTCLYMLVGERVGLTIEGCNFPGHFLALGYDEETPVVIDCFNGGLVIDDKLLARYLDPVSVTVEELTRLKADTRTIVLRVLRNLINAYRAGGDPDNAKLMRDLLGSMSGSREN